MAAIDAIPKVRDDPAVHGRKRWLTRLLRHEELSLVVVLAAVVCFFAVVAPTARSSRAYFDLSREVAPNLIAAIGITLLLLAGELDLSISSMLALTGVVTVETFNRTGNMWLGILAGLLTGPLVGSINGYLVTVLGMNSLMTTLGMMFALRGIVYVHTNKTPVVDEQGFIGFTRFYAGNVGPVPVPAILAVTLIIIFYVVLTRTEFGRNIYAIGGNRMAARVAGIKVQRTTFLLFVLSATLAAVGGLVIASQTDTGYFDAGATGFELLIISSVVLGGVSLAGGEGRLLGAMLGVLILGMTAKGLRLMNVYTTWQLVVTGVVMLVAVYFHRVRNELAIHGRERR